MEPRPIDDPRVVRVYATARGVYVVEMFDKPANIVWTLPCKDRREALAAVDMFLGWDYTPGDAED